MASARFYIPPKNWNLDRLALDDAEAHHCLDVLRLKGGDRAVVFDGEGHEATVEITSATKDRVELKHIHHATTPRLSCEITLGQAVPKGKNMEFIVEKATELGVSNIVPFLSERTVVQIDASESAKKREKWQRVAIEAAKQCGQNWLPEVHTPVSMKAYFDSHPKFDLMLIASLQPDAQYLKAILAELHADVPPGRTLRLHRVLVLIGPEGDFTPAEINLAKGAGCRPITLGSIILRTETAALYCLSVLSHELFTPAKAAFPKKRAS